MDQRARGKSGRRRKSGSLEEDAFIGLQRTADLLARNVEIVLRKGEVSPTQYNVLRILRGAPAGLACGEIAQRMITRDPDITRLLDRMEKRRLVARCREKKDRRLVLTRITPQGLKLLGELDEPVQQIHRKLLGHLERGRLGALQELLELARAKAE